MTSDSDTLPDEKPSWASGAALRASNGAAASKRRAGTRGTERMALKKSDLYRSLWKGADELRGGMDASQYKDYVLTLLFVKYISDRSDRTLLEVPEGASWADITALRNDKEIGDKINKIIARLAEANELQGVIDLADFNDENKLGRGKEMVDRLTKLVGIFDDLDFGSNTAEGDDLLGDAYEYLMRHFATESGKSKGQFYTPAEVSMILARVVGIGPSTTRDQTVYDPTCGSGSLLLKAAHEAPNGMSVYGQEMDNATYALARMNMILHGYETAELWQDNTLSSPHFKETDGSLKKFDFAVANPPFSVKAWTSGLDPAHDEFKRFEGFGIPPDKNGDYAFLLHILKSLKPTAGKAAVILPHGVLFRGNREGDIRRELVKRRLIKGIIGLPANLFYGTGIPACVIVLDKEGTTDRKGVFMIDASKGFIKDGNKNRLRAQDLHKIVDVFTSQTEIEGYSRLVPLQEVGSADNDFNLNIARYIESADTDDIQNIDAHLHGGIPAGDIDALAEYWDALPDLRAELVGDGSRPGYYDLALDVGQLEDAISNHPSWVAFLDTVLTRFNSWRDLGESRLLALKPDDRPKELIADLSESLLSAFRGMPLVDAYRIYQRLMDYWADTLQDDAYQVVADGWKAIVAGDTNTSLLPTAVVTLRYFAPDQAAVDELAAKAEAATQEKQAFEEEHGGEDGLLAEARTDAGKLTKGSIRSRLKEIAKIEAFADEASVLKSATDLLEREASAKKALKDAETALLASVIAKYEQLDEEDVKSLVVERKWLAHLEAAVEAEAERVRRSLVDRIRKLATRYERTLPDLIADIEEVGARVQAHLRQMGFSLT
jgi:type I restriction enzyme M protein